MTTIEYHPQSGVTEMEPRVLYAAGYYTRLGKGDTPWSLPFRPFQVMTVAPGWPLLLIDPLADSDGVILATLPKEGFLKILGRWDDSTPDGGTWQGRAAQCLGEVLRQRDLAQRLTDFGIPRSREGYLPGSGEGNGAQRSLTLNYDELDMLLRAAGF